MGNTSTSLHVLKPAAGVRGFDRNITAAYEALGYAARPAGTEPQKRVAIADAGGDNAFLSIYDSDNALIDNGELKQLAVALSKRLKTAAVLTSTYDSDSFEFVVFHKGKQVDAVVSDPDQHAAGLKMLKAGRRISSWKEMFFVPAIQRALTSDGAAASPAGMNLIMERERAFDQRMQRVGKVEGAFAEDGLSACCEAAGLDVGHALARDPAEDGLATSSVLTFEKVAAGPLAASRVAPGGIRLEAYLSDDDCPSLRYFPTAWPFAVGEPVRTDWLAVSAGAGFSGLKLSFAFDGAPAAMSGKLIVRALPFYNGQITSTTPIASFEQAAPAMADSSWVFDVAPFAVPDLNPEARNRIILIIALETANAGAAAITIRPSITSPAPLALPPVKLQAQRPDWIPLITQDAAAEKASAILKLNTPSVFSMTALLDNDAASLADIRKSAEDFLAALNVADGAELAVATQKHLSASFRIAKTEKKMPLSGAAAHSQWSKLFDTKSDHQTVMLQVMPDGRSMPVAGFIWQAALRNGLRPDPDQALKYLRDTVGPYVAANGDVPPVENEGGTAVSVAVWVLNDPEIFAGLGTTAEKLADMFEGWMTGKAPIQAWITRAAWFPELDFYEQYNQTLYETASTINWFRSHLNGLLTTRAWACRRLRFVASTLWLGKELGSLVDRARLADVAELSPAGDATCVQLRSGRSLGELEAALAPILPVARG